MAMGQDRCRVMHVTRSLDVGGQEKLLVEFARLADRCRFDLHFVCLTGPGRLSDALRSFGWPITTLEEPEGIRPGLVLRLARCFRHWKPDVVHTHDDKPLIYGAWAARLARVPRLIHTKHYARLSQTPRQKELIRFAARVAAPFVCVSRDSANAAIADGIPASKVKTIWNGIDLGRFSFVGGRTSGPVVTVARLSPEKDISTLLRAAGRVARQEADFSLEIAGDGPCRLDLERLAHEIVPGHVRFLNETAEVPGLLARSRFFVLPSITEGISLTLLEAMASGLAVVATRVGGNPEVVADKETGLLVTAQNDQELAAAMLRLWRDPEECRRLGRTGRSRVEQHFDARGMVARYEKLYLAETAPRRHRVKREFA